MRRWVAGAVACCIGSLAYAAPPQRIVALTPHITELVAALAPERLVAVDTASDYPASIKALPHIRSYPTPNIESILAFKPDLVLAWDNRDESRVLAQLVQRGVNVLSVHPQSPLDVATELRRLGKLLQQEAKAEGLAQEQERRYTALLQTYAKRRPVKVFLQISETPLLSISGRSFLGRAIRDCNGVNAFDAQLAAAPQVSREAVLGDAPEMLISTESLASLNSWRSYPQLPAVKHNRLYVLNSDALLRPGPRLIEGMEALCRLIDQARNVKMP